MSRQGVIQYVSPILYEEGWRSGETLDLAEKPSGRRCLTTKHLVVRQPNKCISLAQVFFFFSFNHYFSVERWLNGGMMK